MTVDKLLPRLDPAVTGPTQSAGPYKCFIAYMQCVEGDELIVGVGDCPGEAVFQATEDCRERKLDPKRGTLCLVHAERC